jgi:hypothetical protein
MTAAVRMKSEWNAGLDCCGGHVPDFGAACRHLDCGLIANEVVT